MPVSTLLYALPTPPSIDSGLHASVIDLLPILALAAERMAAIWVACAIVYLAGSLIGYTIFLAVRRLIAACAEYIRRRRTAEYAQLVTVHPDGVTTKVVNLDRYRRRRNQRHHTPRPQHTTDSASDSNDDPA